jgi:hypothetical protein
MVQPYSVGMTLRLGFIGLVARDMAASLALDASRGLRAHGI